MPPALQPERPCQPILAQYQNTIDTCKREVAMRVPGHCVEDMENIMLLLLQEQPLPCDWYGDVICGHVVGALREGGVRVVEVDEYVPSTEFEVDDFVTVATTSEEQERFWLAKVLAIDQGLNGDELQVHWYESTREGKEFKCYIPSPGGDQGRHTQPVDRECCFGVKVRADSRSTRGGVNIQLDVYGKERTAILLAMTHGRSVAEQHDSQENEQF
jgi:hypothetical protein